MIVVRPEEAKDRKAVRLVNEQAFGRIDEARLVQALRDRQKVILSLVAEVDGRVVGHLLFSPMTVDSESGSFKVAALGPMAVLPGYQRRGIGSQLIRQGLDRLRRAGYAAVIVLGHSDYYPRFGFAPASRYGISCPYDAPDDSFMALELQPGSLSGHAGRAVYQPEFDGV